MSAPSCWKSPDDNQNRAVLTVFALHLDTVGGTEYSADYPFYLELNLRQTFGSEIVSLFGNGTCGDINHVDVTNNTRQSGHEETARIGSVLAEAVKNGIPALKPVDSLKLAVRSAVVSVPIQQYAAAETDEARQDMFKVGTPGPIALFSEQVKATKIMQARGFVRRQHGCRWRCPRVFRLSDDLAIVGLPGEVFVDLGLAIKRGSPFAPDARSSNFATTRRPISRRRKRVRRGEL